MGGEVVSRAEELLEPFVLTLERRQTQQTYAHACRRFVRWLGPGAGPADLSLASLAAYDEWLRDPDAFVLVAEQDGSPVGYALITIGEGPVEWRVGERWPTGKPSRCSPTLAAKASGRYSAVQLRAQTGPALGASRGRVAPPS